MVTNLFVKLMAVTLLTLSAFHAAVWTGEVHADGTGSPKCTGNRC
jgi:hypothetical protein